MTTTAINLFPDGLDRDDPYWQNHETDQVIEMWRTHNLPDPAWIDVTGSVIVFALASNEAVAEFAQRIGVEVDRSDAREWTAEIADGDYEIRIGVVAEGRAA